MPVSISATSALVLNWTDPKIWRSPLSAEYMRGLDLSEGESLLARFSEEENFMHTQAVSCRKFFVRKTVCEFLEQLQRKGRSGQVLILAAGLAPLSVEIASLFPASAVFDVDLHNMGEKQKLLGERLPNIAFARIQANSTPCWPARDSGSGNPPSRCSKEFFITSLRTRCGMCWVTSRQIGLPWSANSA